MIQEPGEPPVVLTPAVSKNAVSQWGTCVSNGTGKCVVAVLASEVLAATPVALYPVQFVVKLRVEWEDASCLLYNLLQERVHTSEIFLC